MHARCVALRVWCPGPLGSCSAVCTLGALRCVCGVLGHLASGHRCACWVPCVARAVCWPAWLLFTGVPARCVAFCVRCPGPLGSCSPVCSLGVLRCVCSVLAPWLLLIGVPARCGVLRVRCPGPLGSCSPVCPLGALRCVCGVLGPLALVTRCARRGALCCMCGVPGHLAPVHRCARSVRFVVCAVSSAT